MTTLTQELQVAYVANQIIALTAQAGQMAAQINAMSTQWTNLGVANLLNQFPTAAKTATGGIGTPDASPVTSDPINITVSPGTEINLAVSANSIASMLTYLQGLASAIAGESVASNGAAVQLLALTLGAGPSM